MNANSCISPRQTSFHSASLDGSNESVRRTTGTPARPRSLRFALAITPPNGLSHLGFSQKVLDLEL